MNIYIGNLDKEVTQDELMQVFATFGQVSSVAVIRDKFTGESRGFAFVEMPSQKEAEAAMNGIKDVKGRAITLNEARPRENNFRGGGGGSRGGFNKSRRGGGRNDFRGKRKDNGWR